ncbi:MAG TPA: hypothetical protein VGP79_05840 [Bryobacteraceae bacterium]|jgi:hypothetical protein|nr:hypothetical protein [Bryobacteraceae bacterium]
MYEFARACLLSALVIGAAHAEDTEAAIKRTFVIGWVDAINTKDPARIKRFLHPQLQACMAGAAHEFFDFAINQEARNAPIGQYTVTKISAISGPPPAFLPPDTFTYPVQPSHELQLSFGSTVLIRYLAAAKGSWYEVYPCPNQKGVAFIHEQMAKGAEQQQRARKLLNDLKDPLRSELAALLKQSKLNEATRKYQMATGEKDFTIAVMVMKLLSPR